jgi:hypothetical protein
MNNDAKAKTKEQRHAHRINVYPRCYLGEMQSNPSKCAPFDKNRAGWHGELNSNFEAANSRRCKFLIN